MTWSILARDAQTGALGAAVTTRFFAVGAICPMLRSGVGAVCSQALVNPLWRGAALDRLAAGQGPDDAIAALVAADAGAGMRQLHVMAADGRSARHTGDRCTSYAGHLAGADVSVAGNMLVGPDVLAATLAAFQAASGLPLAARMLAALEAGEAAGGDKRGRQSAALVVMGAADETAEIDLRVDDHPDPLAELRRLYAVAQRRFVPFRRHMATADGPGTLERRIIEADIAATEAAA
ncbi:DUF1028 domain-containing protein [Humitalea sp. 24SJ18S-53]|uniref:DUF1028 domain-containing protein n=1 Tax=Humitalea sp. 24SJ18S-53 TaxID=3422307 RepID=UPI003D679E7C